MIGDRYRDDIDRFLSGLRLQARCSWPVAAQAPEDRRARTMTDAFALAARPRPRANTPSAVLPCRASCSASMRGESLYVAGRLLGHRRASTTHRYVHLDDAAPSRAAERVTRAVEQKLLGANEA